MKGKHTHTYLAYLKPGWIILKRHGQNNPEVLPVLAVVTQTASKSLLNFVLPQACSCFGVHLFPTFTLMLIGPDTNDAKKAKQSGTGFTSCMILILETADFSYLGPPDLKLLLKFMSGVNGN